MKTLIMIATALLLVGCAGSDKKEEIPDSVEKMETENSNANENTDTAENSNAQSGKSTTCTMGKDKRVISERGAADAACEVVYEKFSESKVVATAKYDSSYCSEVREKMAAKLSDAGFTCE